MPRVVPSQVVAVIDQFFAGAATQVEGQAIQLSMGHANQLAAVVDLAEQIPDELIVLNAEDFSILRVSVVGIRHQIAKWLSHGDEMFIRIGGLPHLSPVTLIRRCLVKCPDQAPAAGTAGLAFIADADLRESIRLDISGAHRDMGQGEWKGATVLAGSAIEALLLWALQTHEAQHPGDLASTGAALVATHALDAQPHANPERWVLHEYGAVAGHLNIIRPDTATLVRLAKDFRNLIHPGRAARLGQKCDRATALGALAAVEAVARDLTP